MRHCLAGNFCYTDYLDKVVKTLSGLQSVGGWSRVSSFVPWFWYQSSAGTGWVDRPLTTRNIKHKPNLCLNSAQVWAAPFQKHKEKLESPVAFNPGYTLESKEELLNHIPAQTPLCTMKSDSLGELAISIFSDLLPWTSLMSCWIK